MSKTDRHNRIVRKFITRTLAAEIRTGATDSELMVLAESLVLGVLTVNERTFGVSRAASAARLDSLAVAVAERLGEIPHDH